MYESEGLLTTALSTLFLPAGKRRNFGGAELPVELLRLVRLGAYADAVGRENLEVLP